MPTMKTLFSVRAFHPRRFAAFLLLSSLLLVSSAFAQAPARVVAVADVHGDFDAFVAILQKADLIDDKLHWTGKDATLVQTGDILDRGPKNREVMDLLMALEAEAPRTGGRVIALLGNHEIMNIMGDLRYAASMYASFADANSEKRRKAAYEAYVSWQTERRAAGKLSAAAPAANAEAAWYAAHPLGYVEQREAMSPTGKYGRWLRAHAAVAQVGSTLFVHGGIAPLIAEAGWKPEAIAGKVRSEIKSFDDFTQYLEQQKIILNTFDLAEITTAAQSELGYRNAQPAAATGEGAAERAKQVDLLSTFLSYPSWFSVHGEGPVWFRGYNNWTDAEGLAKVDKLLAGLGVTHIVVGHTPQAGGRIHPRFDGKIFLIDTGMLSSHYEGGRASALEVVAGKITAIYPDLTMVLLDPAAPKGGQALPASLDLRNGKEIPGGGVEENQDPKPAEGQAAEKPAAGSYHVWLDANLKPLPFKSDAEVQDFLRTAKIVKMKDIATGVTHPRKALLEKDGLQVNAKFSAVHERKDVMQLASGQREMNFRDEAIFDMASQELALMLGMDNLPPVVERSAGGEKGILQIWVEDTFTERERIQKKLSPPSPEKWNFQIQIMRMFDNLVYNIDRNQGNILIDKDWKVWLIDQTRAFRTYDTLQTTANMGYLDRGVWEKLVAMDEQTVKDRLKPYLQKYEIEALLKRRVKIIEHFKSEIAKRGESDVIRTMP